MNSTRRLSLVGSAVLLLAAWSGPASADFIENFNAPGPAGNYTGVNVAGLGGHPNTMPAPFETGPDAFSDGEFLRLKEFTSSSYQRSFNSLLFDQTDPGPHDRVTIDFDFRITCGGTRVIGSGFDFRCADGFSVGWMNTAVVGTTGIPSFNYSGQSGTFPLVLSENGVTSAIIDGQVGRHQSFAVGFNTFDNGEGSNDTLNLIFNGGAVGVSRYQLGPDGFDVVTGDNRVRGDFQHAHIDMTLGGASPHVTVSLTDPNGNTITPYDLDLTGLVVAGMPFAPYDGRLGFFTRTGDSQESVDIDNVVVKVADFASVPEPAALALFGLGLAGLGYLRRRRKA